MLTGRLEPRTDTDWKMIRVSYLQSRLLAWPTRTLKVWSTRGVLRTEGSAEVTVEAQVKQNVLVHKRTLTGH